MSFAVPMTSTLFSAPKSGGLFKDSKTDIFIPLKSYELLAAFCKNPKLAIVIAIFQESTSHIVTDSGS